MSEVLLISMPYGAVDRPALGISLLKSILRERGIACDIIYLNFAFADLAGYDDYCWIVNDIPHTAYAGDWTFAEALYGPTDPGPFVTQILRRDWRMSDRDIGRLLRVRALASRFIQDCLLSVPWYQYKLVGFTSTFEQNIASLALARAVKAKHPEVQTVFGGANWEAPMGLELHRRFPFVDFVCSGEADESFPQLVERVLKGKSLHGRKNQVGGVIYRHRRESVYSGPAELVRDLDALPAPDYADFFETLVNSDTGGAIAPNVLVETSRGCWWGAKKHCTFCGLNGGTMAFRSKSDRRVLTEILYLTDRWGIDTVEVVDNILDMKYFRGLIPELAKLEGNLQLFWEVKANLTREQVEQLAKARIRRIQPGIESLSNRVLGLMRKGTTALRNVQLLKWCKQYGIAVDWNILYGFPGERRRDYDATLAMLPALRGLQPPTACGPVRLDRFSPYFNTPEAFGLAEVRPAPAYAHIYPFPRSALDQIAYFFEYNYRPDVDPASAAADVVAYANEWIANPEHGELRAFARPDGKLVLRDTRSVARRKFVVLRGAEKAAYEYCDEMHTPEGVCRHLRREFPGMQFDEPGLCEFLDSLVANYLMVTDGHHYLSLALAAAPARLSVDRPAREPDAIAAGVA